MDEERGNLDAQPQCCPPATQPVRDGEIEPVAAGEILAPFPIGVRPPEALVFSFAHQRGSRVGKDHLGRLFGDHHGRRAGVAGGDARHHGSVGDAQADKTLDLEPFVDHRQRILRRSHFRRPDGMEDRRADVSRRSNEFLVRLQARAGLEFSRRVSRKRGRSGEAAGQADRVHRHPLIGRVDR